MTSRITIEVDFDNNNQPILQIISRQSDDVRDKLIQSFLRNLRGISRWCNITCDGSYGDETDKFQRWIISPLTPDQFLVEGEQMVFTANTQQNTTKEIQKS